ncbi:Receptor-like protein kinase family [Quillaja saponaria]|uniref:non-specific serine/threonine protein kinase n=1 Tax=Quillaja saponaria TaxID=32244 RepID=A0AAD7LRQ7_QUISA|nr:Receptor-like protein kinase family [Quillaja saponaria]
MDYEYRVYFHFAEIQLAPGHRRIINITVNDENFLSEPITLEYLKPLTISPNITTRGYVTFNITPAVGSALLPILNAFEIYRLTPQPNLPTDTGDVDAILEIKGIYGISRINWQGDPCLPSFLMWNGLNCSYGSSPRIVSVDLSSSKLTGEISSSFSRLTELESLDLSYNELTGSLPEFLGELPKLTMLNLTGNLLTGPIPQALLQKSNKTLLLSLGENPSLGWTGSSKKPKFVVPLVTSTSVLVLLILGALVIIGKLKSIRGGIFNLTSCPGTITKSKKGVSLKSKNRAFIYSEVVSITDNFKTTIGEGGFGKVYLGTIQDNVQVAVKLLSSSSMQGNKEFRSEAQLLMIVHHRNLVSLVGYCDEGDIRALIYEYMSNGNLHHQLSAAARNVPKILPWNRRLQIAVDAAQGLDYLHNGCRPPIIHRDMKTSNILLDDKMQAKISDFGLSTAFTNDSDSYISTNPAGTAGYLDPEFHLTGNLNKKSDVYSLGIILLELITGQPLLGKATDENNHHILNWVIPKIENGDIQSAVDPRLQGEFNTNTAWKIVEIALSCTPRSAIQRPDISQVLSELKECLALEMVHDQNDAMDSLKIQSQITEVSAR